MGISLSIRTLVVIFISITLLILGVGLLVKISMMKDVLPPLPVPEKNIVVKVYPESSQEGTQFLIKAQSYEKKEQQDLVLKINGEGYSDFVNLYDDGQHFDDGINDGIYGGFFDSDKKPLGRYEIIDAEKENVLSFFEVYKPNCELVQGSYNDDKINFVILPSGYESYDDFKKDAREIINGRNSLLDIEPFKSNKDEFTFSIINTTRDLECEIGCNGVSTIVCCNSVKVLEEASQCHHDSIFILVNDDDYCGSASSYAKVCSKNDDAKIILVHELGHSFGNLADEYVYSDDYDIGEIDLANCAEEGCEKWKDVSEGCYQGCTYSNLYRSVKKDSMMLDLFPEFNLVCKNQIENLIDDYIVSEEEMERALPSKKSYFVNLKYSEGDIEIENIILKPIKSNVDVRKSDYSIKINGAGGKNIFESNFYVPNKIFPLPNSSARVIELDEIRFSVILPYSLKSDELIIYENEKPIASADLSIFSEDCGNYVCDDWENHVSCPRDCEINKDDFCETSECDPDCESQKNCKGIKIIKKVLIWLLIVGGLLLIIWVVRKRIKLQQPFCLWLQLYF